MTVTMCPGILDVAHWDADGHKDLDADLEKAIEDGIVGVVAKATQGKNGIDAQWARWVDTCRRASSSVDYGAYHFASNTEPGDLQADFFLSKIASAGLDPRVIVVTLDFERNPDPSITMDLAHARSFVQHVRDKVGKWPFLYGDVSFHHQITDPKDVLVNCPLWVAMYGGYSSKGPPIPPAYSAAGKTWTWWQYTDGKYCAHGLPQYTPGFSRMDRSVYRGGADDLRSAWSYFGA